MVEDKSLWSRWSESESRHSEVLKDKEPSGREEGEVRQYLTGFSCHHCKLPSFDFPDVRGRGEKRGGRGDKFLTFQLLFIFLPLSLWGWWSALKNRGEHRSSRVLSCPLCCTSKKTKTICGAQSGFYETNWTTSSHLYMLFMTDGIQYGCVGVRAWFWLSFLYPSRVWLPKTEVQAEKLDIFCLFCYILLHLCAHQEWLKSLLRTGQLVCKHLRSCYNKIAGHTKNSTAALGFSRPALCLCQVTVWTKKTGDIECLV